MVVREFFEDRSDIGVVTVNAASAAGQTEMLVATSFVEAYGEVSPDGRWIAYSTNESGRSEVYVRPFPNVDDGRWRISRDGGYGPVWGRSTQELFFRQRQGTYELMAVAFEAEATFSPGNPAVLYSVLPTSGPAISSGNGILAKMGGFS